MPLHRVSSLTLGVPDPEAAGRFYEDFGLVRTSRSRFATQRGGDQLTLVQTPVRRLVEAAFAADDPDDLDRISQSLAGIGILVDRPSAMSLVAVERVTGVRVRVSVEPRLEEPPLVAPVYNGPGRYDRINARAAALHRTAPVRPQRLGHFVLGSTDFDVTMEFFVRGLGFKVSDLVSDHGVFLRCSTDHHNVLVQKAPVPFLHHTSWQVDDVDEVGRGAMAMIEDHPERHVWGLGRHYAGSNFFWYLKDPSGNFAEYHSDMDCIPEDALWTPEVLEGARGLFQWGPPPPPSFINPEDLAALMISEHSSSS